MAECIEVFGMPIFNGFFFEIVQRKGGYQGYGTRDVPIRSSARMHHRRAKVKE